MAKCKECENELVGRSDKKFCSDYCRNAFNNRLNSDHTKLMRNINNILRKNRRILEEMNPNKKNKFSKEALLYKGFNFSYFTNIYKTKTGKTYYFCYDQGYLFLDNEFVTLIVRKDYVK